ncbi:hypothetical protein [uncultured Eudoraea sp.]|uniref:hypothetical protein n=1 Tax=uncultured Eudoraea sp. TaxID=1035614 RepID=UPI00260D0EF0|nr:hypothetical protein [uncultured Eudoraea sp.]
MTFGKFISELKRRNVFKATIAYLAVAWVIVQLFSVLFPAFNAPDYATKVLIYVLAVGLVFWIAFSWIYDWTPDGLQKTDDTIDDEETKRLTNRRLNIVIGSSLTLAVILLIAISFYAGASWNDNPILEQSKKVAVIPFVHEVEDPEEDYFMTGMTEELINELSKVDQLTVISQASSKVFYSNIGPATILISNELRQIDYFVQGTVERQLNKLTIQLELKESTDAAPIWKKSYSKDISQVRQLWAEAARDLAGEMGMEVKQDDAILWSNLRPVKPETYELYLKGKHYLNKSTVEDWQRGLVYLQEAIDENPADAYAYAGMAEGYITVGHSLMPPPDVFPKALAAAKRAIQLDSTNAEGWAALAHYHTYFGWDWQLAEYAFHKANDLNPNMAYNHYHRAWYLALFGRMNEAIEEHKRAQELDPFTPLHTAWLGALYRMVGEYEKGIIEADRAIQMQDDYALGMLIKGRILIDQGNIEEGLEMLKQAASINPGWKYMGYGPALISAGYIEEGKAIIKELENMPRTPFFSLCLGMLYTNLGDFDKAFEWSRHAKKHAWHPWIRVVATNEEFRKDPRFLALIHEMNLPDPAPLVYDPDIL